MKKLSCLLAAMMFGAMSAGATSYYQTPSLNLNNIQGELFSGMGHTNAGWGTVTELPLTYHNADLNSGLSDISQALACGGAAGSGNVEGGCGVYADVGPQLEYLIVTGVGAINSSAGDSVSSLFSCAKGSTACASISAGAFGNLNLVDGGQLETGNAHRGSDPRRLVTERNHSSSEARTSWKP